MVHSLELMVHSLEMNSNCVQIGFIFSNLEIWNIAHMRIVFYNSCLELFFFQLLVCYQNTFFFSNLRISVEMGETFTPNNFM